MLLSSGVVAFGIISLLPVELILQAGSGHGFAMVYALLFSAIIWNLGTWYFGLPSSSSHTLIGSIIGVGVANALLHGRSGTSGVDWDQALKVGYALLLSPIVGFVCAALLLLALKALVRNRQLYQAPDSARPPPVWIRGLLILTCTGVSFAHGSNDGQKGMGLIMLILVGTMPIAYALNRSLPPEQIPRVAALAQVTEQQLLTLQPAPGAMPAPRTVLTEFVRSRQPRPQVLPALGLLLGDISDQIRRYGSVNNIPAQAVTNTRNDMYLASESIRHLQSSQRNAARRDRPQSQRREARAGQRHALYSALGKSGGGAGAGSGHAGGLATYRHYGRRAHRQIASQLCPGCQRRTGCDGDYRRS